ncbi:MAG: translocation/assembly module TamB domain-containing protein, partial [Rhodanobacter sp.]
DFHLTSSGSLAQAGPDATLEIVQLGGKLRDHPISGHGKLHLTPSEVLDGQLALASGNSTIALNAQPGTRNSAELTVAIASLGDWLPNASGRLDGHLTFRGKAQSLSVNGQLHGKTLAWQQEKADALQLIVGIPDLSKPSGKLDLQT